MARERRWKAGVAARAERKAADKERRQAAREAAKAQAIAAREAAKAERRQLAQAPVIAREAAKEAERAATLEQKERRRRARLAYKQGVRKRAPSLADEQETAARIAHLTALLMGTHDDERIANSEGNEMAASELQALWLRSGDHECTTCKLVVPPTAMRAPGPANFYTGQCNSCASAECREHQLRVYGRPTAAPTILLRDGTSCTIAAFAARVAARQRGTRTRS